MNDSLESLVDTVSLLAHEVVHLPELRGPFGGWDGAEWSWRWMNPPDMRERVEVGVSVLPQLDDKSVLLRVQYSCWLGTEAKFASGAQMGAILIPIESDSVPKEWIQKQTERALERALACASRLDGLVEERKRLRQELEDEGQAFRRTATGRS